jgi:hypothetical protein
MTEEEILKISQDTYGDVNPDLYGGSADRAAIFGNKGYGEGMSGAQTSAYDAALNTTNSPELAKIISSITGFGSDVFDFFKENPWAGKIGLPLLLAALASRDKAPPTGGGVAYAYKGPEQQLTRTMVPGPQGGPIAQYAASGGIMHAYANGGSVRPFPMQDGGFVFTKRAVDGAQKTAGGINNLVPEARMIRGPGHGTSDSIPAYIEGRNGVTPARVSNGEAYAPPGRKAQDMYALMKQLERMA